MPINPYIKRVSDNEEAVFLLITPDNPHTAQPVIQPIDRPNVPGYAFQVFAEKAEPWTARCFRDFPSSEDARAAIQNLRNGLIGKMCEIYMYDGIGYGRMMCMKVIERYVRSIGTISGGLGATGGGDVLGPLSGSGNPAVAEIDIVFVHAGPEAP